MSSPTYSGGDVADSPLLLGLMEQELAALFAFADRQAYQTGDLIVREGSPSDCLYILVSGVLEVVRMSEGNPVVLATLTEAGSFFGEMSLVDTMPRSADIRAKTHAEIVAFSKRDLTSFFVQLPRVQMTMILNIARNLSLRLRDADAHIMQLSSDLARARR
ncbi:MAG: cyclic nucleotide-binding domain-containing protein [Candidatus Latescibacterota bacterium]|nr:cyclic nucleotide-binding domain-containing protein [Candidatus Latescibacterota bacterium]